jgi:hypothetical protein
MGRRANALDGLLRHTGLRPAKVGAPSLAALPPAELHRARDIYLTLGGVDARFALARTGSWDLSYEDGLTVELDEEHHFNRYRLLTIDSLDDRPWFSAYREYCVAREHRAGRSGGWWTNASCEKMFGPSSAPGDLSEPGPARWKQRAFYDAVKDLQSLVSFARVSIYDIVGGRQLGRILSDPTERDAHVVAEFVRSRVHVSAQPLTGSA